MTSTILWALFWMFFLFVGVGGTVAGWWGMFTKAGAPGWAACVPGYNLFLLTRMAGIGWYWSLLFLVPLANLGMWAVVSDQLALRFGKGIGTSIGMVWLSFVFCPILGFGAAAYEGERLAEVPRQRTRREEEDEPPRRQRRSDGEGVSRRRRPSHREDD
jgi:hypothetical protein